MARSYHCNISVSSVSSQFCSAPCTTYAVHRACRNDWVQHRCVAPRLLQHVVWCAVHVTRQTAAQSRLARVVTQSSSRTSARPRLQSLHWLPIRERINYKVATLTFKARRMSAPPYLNSLLNDHVPSRTLVSDFLVRRV